MAPTNKTSVDTVDKNKCYICVKKLLRSSKVIICSVCDVSVHTECANYDEGSVSAYKCEKCTMNSSDTSIETVIDKHASGESYITQRYDHLLVENDLLKRLLREMEEKNSLLYYKIDILEQKIIEYENIKNNDIKPSNTVSNSGSINLTKTKTKDSSLVPKSRNLQSFSAVVQNPTAPVPVSSTAQAPSEKVSNEHSTNNSHGVNNGRNVTASTDDHKNDAGSRDTEPQKEWINVTRKKSRRNTQSAIIGSAKNMCSVKAAPKKVSLFVSRLQSGTKSEDLVTALRETFPEVVCEEITPKHPESYASFKVFVNYTNLETALEPSSWPEGAKSFKGGGVGIWCKDSVEVKSIDLEKFCIEKSIEICGIIFENNGNKTAVLSCYRSPINQNFQVFCEKLEEIFEENFDSSTNFILCGDFNVDAIRDEINYKALTSILESYGLKNTVHDKTRNSYSIDHIFSNIDTNSKVIDNHFSDHKGLLFRFQYERRTNDTFMFKRSFSDENITKFIDDISRESWENVYKCSHLNDSFNAFYGVLCHYFNLHFPLKKFYNKQDKSWVDDNLKSSSENLKDLHILTKSFPELIPLYRDRKVKHTQLIESTKRLYYANKINNSKNVTKGAWNVVQMLRNKSHSRIKDNNAVIINTDQLADKFNHHFVDTPKNIVRKIPFVKYYDGIERNTNTMFLFPFEEKEFLSLMAKKLKPKYSCGFDGIPSFLIKKCINELTAPLVHLINLSFCEGTFPEQLKLNKIIPVFKKGDKDIMSNYRPIALSPNSFKKFNVLTLPSIVIMELALLIYNNQNDFNRNKDFHDYSTRGREMYTIPLTKYRIGRHSPAFLGVKIFNKLGNDMKNIKNQITFKNKLKTFLLERCYYTIDEFLLE
nr:unnamed protein product [Callosobruchus chinensis]